MVGTLDPTSVSWNLRLLFISLLIHPKIPFVGTYLTKDMFTNFLLGEMIIGSI